MRRLFNTAQRELGGVAIERPSWEDDPSTYPITTLPWGAFLDFRDTANITLDGSGRIASITSGATNPNPLTQSILVADGASGGGAGGTSNPGVGSGDEYPATGQYAYFDGTNDRMAITVGGGGTVVDQAGETNTVYHKPTTAYNAATGGWAGIASAGNSGSHSFSQSTAGARPAAVAGYPSGDGSNDFLTSNVTLADVYATDGSEGFCQVVFIGDTAVSQDMGTNTAQAPFNANGVYTDSVGYWCIGFCDVLGGAPSVVVGAFDGVARDSGGGPGTNDGWQMIVVPCAAGIVTLVQVRWDSALTELQVRVRNADDPNAGWVACAFSTIGNVTGVMQALTNWNAANFLDGKLLHVIARQTYQDDTKCDEAAAAAQKIAVDAGQTSANFGFVGVNPVQALLGATQGGWISWTIARPDDRITTAIGSAGLGIWSSDDQMAGLGAILNGGQARVAAWEFDTAAAQEKSAEQNVGFSTWHQIAQRRTTTAIEAWLDADLTTKVSTACVGPANDYSSATQMDIGNSVGGGLYKGGLAFQAWAPSSSWSSTRIRDVDRWLDAEFMTSSTTIGPLTGSTTINLAPAATLKGTGALTGSSTVNLAPSATLRGTGALTGTSAISLAPSATLRGTGALTGTSALNLAPAGTLTGAGSLTGSSTANLAPSATLQGTGALNGSSAVSLAPAGALTGAGAMTGTSTIGFVASGTLRGTGALTGSSSVSVAPQASTLVGAGALTGSSTISVAPSATLSGAGALGGSTTLSLSPVGTIQGVAQLVGSSSLALAASGSIQGSGALVGTGSFAISPQPSALTGAGALTGTSSISFAGSAVLDGVGALAGTSSAALSPAGNLQGIAPLAGTSPLSLAANASALTGAGALDGNVPLAFVSSGSIEGDGTIVGTSSFALSLAAATLLGVGALQGSSPVAITPQSSTMQGAGALSGTTTISLEPDGIITGIGSGAMQGDAAIEFTATGLLQGLLPATGEVEVSFDASGVLQGNGPLVGEASLALDVVGALGGEGALAGETSMTFDVDGAIDGIGPLSGTSSMTFDVSPAEMKGAGALVGDVDLFVDADGTLEGAGRLVGATTLALVATGVLADYTIPADLSLHHQPRYLLDLSHEPAFLLELAHRPRYILSLEHRPSVELTMSHGNIYDVGDLAEVIGTFRRKSDSALVDPTTLTAYVQPPSGPLYVVVYDGVDTRFVRDSLGIFRLFVPITSAGTWSIQFVGTGSAEAMQPTQLRARSPLISVP